MSIWLDLYEKRNELSVNALKKLESADEELLFSDAVVVELNALGYGQELGSLLRQVGALVRKVHVSQVQTQEARRLASRLGVPNRDALHAILARDNDAVLVSRDRHFELLRSVVEVRRPEELLK